MDNDVSSSFDGGVGGGVGGGGGGGVGIDGPLEALLNNDF